MAQDFPAGLRSILAEVGQAAIEVDCGVEGFREFVTVFRCDTARMANFGNRFPYLRSHPVVFRVMRFRVEATLIGNHIYVSMEALVGLQSLYVPSEEVAMGILDVWGVPAASLVSPAQTAIPV